MSDDITFCGSDCGNKKCFRHPSNIAEPHIPHSFAYFKDTEDCPYKVKNTMTPEKAVERVIEILQSCKRYFYKEDEQAIDIAIQLLKEGEIYMTAEDFNLYMEGYKQGKKDFARPQGEWIEVGKTMKNGKPVAIRCDKCGKSPKYAVRSDFCPNCGADMRGEITDENSN